MSRIAFVNGQFVPHAHAQIHIEDRGYQFADGVYEVWAVRDGTILDEADHFARLCRSLTELQIGVPVTAKSLGLRLRQMMRRNRMSNGLIYMQVTRGVAPRVHVFPSGNISPSVILTAKHINWRAADKRAEKGVTVVSRPDERWARRDIKSTAILPNILARQSAKEAGSYEAWLIGPDGYVTEGAASTAWIITDKGEIWTRAFSHQTLPGITRHAIFQTAHEMGLKLVERAFTLKEATAASEAFLSGAGSGVMPIIRIDEAPVGDGTPGKMALLIRHNYVQLAKKRADNDQATFTFPD